MNNLQKYKDDYKKLKEYGVALQYGFLFEHKKHPNCKKVFNDLDGDKKEIAEKYAFSKKYDAWYNESLRLIKQLMPERYDDFVSFLFNIKELLKADIFDSELDGAKELYKNGFYRAAGALCGVILEKHFAGVCASHNIKIKKATPGISDFNEMLKDERVIDNKTYLLIQRLGTIRNLCDHNKKQEPSKDDISDLICGTDKVLHEVL